MTFVLLFKFRDRLLSILLVPSLCCRRKWPVRRLDGMFVALRLGFSGGRRLPKVLYNSRHRPAWTSRRLHLSFQQMTSTRPTPASHQSTSSRRSKPIGALAASATSVPSIGIRVISARRQYSCTSCRNSWIFSLRMWVIMLSCPIRQTHVPALLLQVIRHTCLPLSPWMLSQARMAPRQCDSWALFRDRTF